MTTTRWIGLLVVVALVVWFAFMGRRLARQVAKPGTRKVGQLEELVPGLSLTNNVLPRVATTARALSPLVPSAHDRLVALGLVSAYEMPTKFIV